MPPTAEPHPLGHQPGSHTLGPHVVGLRVVVRRLLRGETGPTGGPAFTDVLGTCRRWADGLCVLEREDGTVVEVRVADIVSGKPVPPRPSVRHRVGVGEAERHTASLWPGLEVEPLGEWVLRSDPSPVGRLVKRANSCLAVGDPGLPPDAAAAAVRAFYAARDRPALVHVEPGSAPHAALLDQGWREVPGGAAYLLLASTARALRRAREVAAADEVDLTGTGTGTGVTVSVRSAAGAEAARGAAALDGDWLGVHRLHVDPSERRRGLATAVLAALLEWGAEQGATTAWLHVETQNAAALALYERLGFAVHHEMTYLTA
ncbi:GNAT family N-acetyltransferase [Nocardioides solisilvae]|uniref:GNAT family N-acetyltransferase n=1 Tax=Nocardioides solisilvae TaxID=1542435 RepID=UPI000D748672|nr:GNAT family N-acetyltransferase [Nocardioides solisilvae]